MSRSKLPAITSADIPSGEFDPLTVENIGVTLAVELLEQPTVDFPPREKFNGPGVYALYYTGDHPAYAPLVEMDQGRCVYPVYVGQAARQNAKQGFNPRPSHGAELFNRIDKHYKSVSAAENIDASDFRVRYLALKPAYINLAESVLIMAFRPPWNGMGLGSNVTGGPRMLGKGSYWDALHPGRQGRPAGSEETAVSAAAIIARRVTELQEPSPDPIVRRMHERIMKFV